MYPLRNKTEQTLAEYIARKQEAVAGPAPKLSFNEWWADSMSWQFSSDSPEMMRRFEVCWKAAQENK